MSTFYSINIHDYSIFNIINILDEERNIYNYLDPQF